MLFRSVMLSLSLPQHGLATITYPYSSNGGYQVAPGVSYETGSLVLNSAYRRDVRVVEVDPASPLVAIRASTGNEEADRLTVAVVSRGSTEDSRAKAAKHDLVSVLLQRDYEVADAYQVFETPAAVLVQPDGTIGGGVARGGEQIRRQVAEVLDTSEAPPWSGLVPLPIVRPSWPSEAPPDAVSSR